MSPSYHHSRSPDYPSYDSPMLTPSPLRRNSLYTAAGRENPEPSISLISIPRNSKPLRTPVKASRHPNRFALSDKHLNHSPETPQAEATRVGVGTKRKSTPLSTPLRPHALSPLKVISPTKGTASGTLRFDRLAPLAAPKFAARTPQSRSEAEAHLSRQTATLTRLKLTDHCDSDDELDAFVLDQDDEGAALFSDNSKTAGFKLGAIKSLSGLKGKEKEEVAEAISPGGQIVKRRARSRPVSAELQQSVFKSPKSPARSNSFKHRQRHGGAVTFPTAPAFAGFGSPPSPTMIGSPRLRNRISESATHVDSKPFPTRPPLSRHDNVSAATLFFGPSIPQPKVVATAARSRTNTTSGGSAPLARPPLRPNPTNRHSYGGSRGGSMDLDTWNTIQHRPMSPLSPRSSPPAIFVSEGRSIEYDDEDMFFGAGPADSSLLFNLTEAISSPAVKKALPRKYNPQDTSLTISDEDEMLSTSSNTSGEFLMPRASTSVTSFFSDDGLVTPGAGPDTSSGWPAPSIFIKGADDSGMLDPHSEDGVDVDAFIARTLAAASKGPENGKKRVPGTPVKKVRTITLSERPWQSAVAAKVGLKDDYDFKKVPRKSLPAAFPAFASRKGGIKASDSTDSEGEDDSPIGRKDQKYVGLGLGRPTPAVKDGISAIPRSQWLMRRSSSGFFSSGGDSMISTPTRGKNTDWQLPNQLPAQLTPSSTAARSTSGSSTSSTATLNSPTNGARQLRAPEQRCPAPRPSLISAARRLSYEASEEEQPGRFGRDFVELEEIGSGEFGKVIKVRSSKSNDDTEVYAIKKSKQFEGSKHRLRLREEVDILKYLSQAAVRAGLDGRHPNVLAYIDSWEENEALYIRTELCESGNLARFLWEYGRVFPRLDEARVWKIVADLGNGLSFIHDAGVIHLDLKPSNVFVTKEGRFKIGDFGMASLWPRVPPFDVAGIEGGGGFEREGDKLYLAPEVLQGKYGKAADVFSFGMTILETASNIVVPDQGPEWHRLRQEDFSQVDLEDSPELFALIKQMMRTEPACRISVHGVCDHPIVTRARMAMEKMDLAARRNETDPFAASPLASVPDGFLEEILGRGGEDEGAMDTSP